MHLMRTLEFQPVEFEKGTGPYLHPSDGGDPYIDFFCDVGTASLGYGYDALRPLLDMRDQRIPPHTPNLYGFTVRNQAARKICEMTGMERVFFSNSGAESVEAAIKLARLWQAPRARNWIFSIKGGFHGRTLATLAAGDGPEYHRYGFGPMPLCFGHFSDIDEIPSRAAAVLIAPVFGNNDVQEYSAKWLSELADYCRARGILLIFDEVQSGSGRCGTYTYAQRVGIEPDIICLAKGVAGGIPVGATLARGPVSDAFYPGSHFSTFGGNPLGAMGVLNMWDWLERDVKWVDKKGDLIRQRLRSMGLNPRGPGMLIAFDWPGDVLALAAAAREERLLIGAFRSGPGPVKITPPLNIARDDLEDGLRRLAAAVAACS